MATATMNVTIDTTELRELVEEFVAAVDRLQVLLDERDEWGNYEAT